MVKEINSLKRQVSELTKKLEENDRKFLAQDKINDELLRILRTTATRAFNQ